MRKQTMFITIFLGLLFVPIGATVIYFLEYKNDERIIVKNEIAEPEVDTNDKLTSTGEQVLSVGDIANSKKMGPKFFTDPSTSEFSEYQSKISEKNALYVDLKVGNGAVVNKGNNVVLIYKGWLTNGKVFDQTGKNEAGQLVPIAFKLGSGQVIPGWEQGIEGMKVGGQRRLVLPPAVGYGEQGKGPIPPNSVLVFDVELIDAQEPGI